MSDGPVQILRAILRASRDFNRAIEACGADGAVRCYGCGVHTLPEAAGALTIDERAGIYLCPVCALEARHA